MSTPTDENYYYRCFNDAGVSFKKKVEPPVPGPQGPPGPTEFNYFRSVIQFQEVDSLMMKFPNQTSTLPELNETNIRANAIKASFVPDKDISYQIPPHAIERNNQNFTLQPGYVYRVQATAIPQKVPPSASGSQQNIYLRIGDSNTRAGESYDGFYQSFNYAGQGKVCYGNLTSSFLIEVYGTVFPADVSIFFYTATTGNMVSEPEQNWFIESGQVEIYTVLKISS